MLIELANAGGGIYSRFNNRDSKYKEIKYGKKVTDLYLVCLHPDRGYKTYDRIKVQMLDKEIKDLFEFRKEQIKETE